VKLSDEGYEFIKRHEGVIQGIYRDPVGLLTGGIGHLIDPLEKGPQNIRWAEGHKVCDHQVRDWFEQDVIEVEDAVTRLVVTQLSQKGFDALVSFTFNVGIKAFRNSTLLRKLNFGRVEEAAEEFPRWNKSRGKVLPGLVRRRREEKEMFLMGEVEEFLA
jgi:lysozyme